MVRFFSVEKSVTVSSPSSKLPFICFVLFEHWHSCSMMFSSWLFNKSWQWLYSRCFTQFEASRDNCIRLVRFCSILFDYISSIGSKIELTAKYVFDFVRLPNPIERLVFDWVRVVFCSVLCDWIGRVSLQDDNQSLKPGEAKSTLRSPHLIKCITLVISRVFNLLNLTKKEAPTVLCSSLCFLLITQEALEHEWSAGENTSRSHELRTRVDDSKPSLIFLSRNFDKFEPKLNIPCDSDKRNGNELYVYRAYSKYGSRRPLLLKWQPLRDSRQENT